MLGSHAKADREEVEHSRDVLPPNARLWLKDQLTRQTSKLGYSITESTGSMQELRIVRRVRRSLGEREVEKQRIEPEVRNKKNIFKLTKLLVQLS